MLDLKRPLYVKKAYGLKYNGKDYKHGEPLDMKLGIRDHRVLQMMYDQGRITHDAPHIVTEPKPVEAAPVVAPATVASPARSGMPQAELVNTGKGWYNVTVYGTVVNTEGKIKGRKSAEEWAQNNGFEVLTES